MPEIDIGPKVYYAPEDKRQQVLLQHVVCTLLPSRFTTFWQSTTRPVARLGVPAFALVAGVDGLMMNLRSCGAKKAEKASKFIIGGYCPGTSIVATMSGKLDALVFVGVFRWWHLGWLFAFSS